MWNLISNSLYYDMKKLIYLTILLIYFSCGLSTEELRLEVKNSIIETIEVDPDFKGVKVVDLSLIHKSGNEYVGILDAIEPNTFAEAWNTLLQVDALNEQGIKVKYDVEVIYDGLSFIWELKKQD